MKLTRLALLVACGVWIVASCQPNPTPTPTPNAPTRPNLLLVTIDTLRYDRVGVFAPRDPYLHTPNMDALAAKGTIYTHAYTTAPLTLPAHASLLTGLLPPWHRIRDNAGYCLSPGVTTLAEVLRDIGYDTAAFVSASTVAKGLGLEQGFAHYDDSLGPPPTAGTLPERNGTDTVTAALAWLNRPRSRSYFAWVHLFDPHYPYLPASDLRPPHKRRPVMPLPSAEPDQVAWAREVALYDAEVTWADAQLGRLVAAVDSNTAIIITSDHGESLGDHGEATHGFLCFNSTLRVPLIVVRPGGSPPAVVNDLVSLAAVPLTALELVGAPKAARDRLPTQMGALPDARPPYFESFYGTLHFQLAPIRAVATDESITMFSTALYRLPVDQTAAQQGVASTPGAVLRLNQTAATADTRAALEAVLTAARQTPALGDPRLRRPPAIRGGFDPGAYPGLGAGGAPIPTPGGYESDATWGVVLRPTLFTESLEADLELPGPSPLSPATLLNLGRYQRAQRLVAGGKYGLAVQCLREMDQKLDLPPARLLGAEAFRRMAEEAYSAAADDNRRRKGVSRDAWKDWVPRGDVRAEIVNHYAAAAAEYSRYVALMLPAVTADNDADAAADLHEALGMRLFFAQQYADAEAALRKVPAERLRLRSRMAFALALHFQGGREFAKLWLEQQAGFVAGAANAEVATLRRLIQRLADPALSRDPADLNPEFGFP